MEVIRNQIYDNNFGSICSRVLIPGPATDYMNGMRYSKQSVENTRTIDGLDWLNTARVVAEISCLFTFSSVAVEQ